MDHILQQAWTHGKSPNIIHFKTITQNNFKNFNVNLDGYVYYNCNIKYKCIVNFKLSDFIIPSFIMAYG